MGLCLLKRSPSHVVLVGFINRKEKLKKHANLQSKFNLDSKLLSTGHSSLWLVLYFNLPNYKTKRQRYEKMGKRDKYIR